MSTAPSMWAGLAQRGMDDESPDDFARPSIQRTVDAATAAPIAPPPGAVVSPFHHPYVASGSQATQEEPAAANPTTPATGEDPMPNATPAKKRKPRQSSGAAPQFQICALLMAKGDLTLDELKADVSADATPFKNALYNAKKGGRVVFIQKADKYRLTKEGRDWVTGGANLANQQATDVSAPPPKATARPPARLQRVVMQPVSVETVVERSFRCAVFSDGGFSLTKGGQSIELTPAEFTEMQQYARRMGELAA